MTSSRRRFGAGDVARFAAAVPVLFMLDAMVRLVGVRRTQRILQRLVPVRRSDRTKELRAEQQIAPVSLALDRAAARVCRWPGRCLRRSLALWAWLRLQGIDADINIGVRREGQALVGHAWVSHQGHPIAESADTLADHVSFGAIASR